MTASVPYVRERTRYLNTQYFGGELPAIEVLPCRARSYLGHFEVKDGVRTIRISSAYDLQPEELDDVILHEMIHYYISWKGIRDDAPHGRRFRQIMDELNTRCGRHIVVRYKSEGPVQPRRTSPKYFCVSTLRDGTVGITVCASTRVFQLRRLLPLYYRIKHSEWYWSADPYFSRFPRSVSPKIYRVSPEELSPHLSSATRMQFKGRTFAPAE